jgi:hypothetical protein
MLNTQEGNNMQATATQTLTLDLITATAFAAADAYEQKYYPNGGWGACGFAWVNVYLTTKGNTREGKAERKTLEALGFRKDYTGAYQMWNPSKYATQNVDTLEAGAEAAAQLLKAHGYTAYAGSRLD